MPTSLAKSALIPVYLLTGYLGSGKTTLLASWMREAELAASALIINEVGEVGLDQHVLRGVTEDAALVANACICCTGLPGLEQALADLFWARLQRKMLPYNAVVIETTGLADPLPIVALFKTDALLRERYRLAGIVTVLSATSGISVLAQYPEAVSQVGASNLVIISKTDLAPAGDVAALKDIVSGLNPGAGLATSAKASFPARAMLEMLQKTPTFVASEESVETIQSHDHDSDRAHAHEHAHHGAQTQFFPLPTPLTRKIFWAQLERWIQKHRSSLLRIKGLVRISDGSLVTVQWSLGDTQAEMALFSTQADAVLDCQTGLTVIIKKVFGKDEFLPDDFSDNSGIGRP